MWASRAVQNQVSGQLLGWLRGLGSGIPHSGLSGRLRRYSSASGDLDQNRWVHITRRLDQLADQKLLRRYVEMDQHPTDPLTAYIDGQPVLTFCTNDYLGLAKHPALRQVMRDAIARYGCGTGGVRSIGGTLPLHNRVERRLADFHGYEAATLFISGFDANAGVLGCLGDEGDLIFSDQRNHASIVDGCRLSRAKTILWRHNDPEDLRRQLRENPTAGKRIVVCESLYSMDGNFANLDDILAVAEEHDCFTYVDEIHSTGMCGPRGSGYVAERGLRDKVDFLMGGAGKSFGVIGGHVASSRVLENYIKSLARTFIFTTSAPAVILAAILKSIDLIEQADSERATIQKNANRLRHLLDENGFDYGASESHIVPIRVGAPDKTKLASQLLIHDHRIYVQGIVYPSVEYHQGRLRLTVTPHHTEAHMQTLIQALRTVRDRISFQSDS